MREPLVTGKPPRPASLDATPAPGQNLSASERTPENFRGTPRKWRPEDHFSAARIAPPRVARPHLRPSLALSYSAPVWGDR